MIVETGGSGSLCLPITETGFITDDYFADLYRRSPLGRPAVPARTLVTVMILQAFRGSL